MTLGQKLKQTRLARGMTQSQVVGDRITRNMLSQIENDLASPSVGTLEYLASVLNVRLSWLLADEQEEAEAGRTQRLRELLKSGEYAACLELAPEHAPDDEQALALAMAAAQCAQRALESERFDTARHLAQRGLAWNNGSLYASAALMLHLRDKLGGKGNFPRFGVWLLQDFGAPIGQKRHRQRTFCVEIVLVHTRRASVDDGFLATGQQPSAHLLLQDTGYEFGFHRNGIFAVLVPVL